MHRPHAPTVRQLLTGALVASAVAAAAPAMASAANDSVCSYDAAFHRVTVTDNSGNLSLRLVRVANGIAIQDGVGALQLCGTGSSFATVTNTDKILINTPGSPNFDKVTVDMSNGAFVPGFIQENDGNSEIEVQVRLTGALTTAYEIVGTSQADTIKLADRSSVLLGSDNDVDISMVSAATAQPRDPGHWTVSGGGGNDFISARGAFPAASPKPTSHIVDINGGDGSDNLVDGLSSVDGLNGGPGNDALFAADGLNGDQVTGGPDVDVATLDAGDTFTSDVEQNTGGVVVGHLKLAPAVVKAKPGKVADMAMSWTHPKAWKALRAIDWRVYDGAKVLGTVKVSPSGGKLSADGLTLVKRRSSVGHEGKTVTAKLAVRVPKAVAGHQLRIDVQATDRNGRTQLAPSAGLIRVAK